MSDLESTTVTPGGEAESLGDSQSSPFIGDLTAEDTLSRLNSIPELQEALSASESRFSEGLEPLRSGLDEVRTALGQRTAFEPKFEKARATAVEYDERFGPVLDAIVEDLKGSLQLTPLDSAALTPHLEPAIQAAEARMRDFQASRIIDQLPFQVADLRSDDAGQLTKDFDAWWNQASLAERSALAPSNEDENAPPADMLEFALVLETFDKWRSKRTQEKGKAAGEAASRLEQGRQPRSGAAPTSQKSDPFQDGLDYIKAQYER